jgi:phosphoesterase RecJ-like protein
MEDSEGIVGTMRSIKGIDIAVLVKEVKENVIKVSMRAKEGNVSDIAVRFGGGGHVKAAGCTLNGNLAAVRGKMQKAVEESLCRE